MDQKIEFNTEPWDSKPSPKLIRPNRIVAIQDGTYTIRVGEREVSVELVKGAILEEIDGQVSVMMNSGTRISVTHPDARPS